MTSGVPRSKDKSPPRPTAGYTLLELLVVMVIVAILATQVVFTFTNPMARVKAAAFNMRADMNLARSEAVNRHTDVLVEFVAGVIDGYRICIDTNNDGFCTDEADNATIKIVNFRDEVQFYDTDADDGPTKTPDGVVWAAADFIPFGNNKFKMKPNGTSDTTAGQDAVYIYVPEPGDPTVMRAPPMAMVVSENSGRVRLERWRKEEGPDGAWKEK